MQFNIFNWLFQTPDVAGSGIYPNGVEPFRFFWPYMIFCIVGLVIWFYYWVEGRKRFVKNKPLIKYMFDRYLGWFAVICFVGIPIAVARVTMEQYFFAWRFWRYLWLLSLVIWAIIWLVYLIRKYPDERAYFVAYQKRQQYIAKPHAKQRKARPATH